MELGLTHLSLNEMSEARLWLDRARRDYTGYLLETIVHFRVHCAMRIIKAKALVSASNDNSPVVETAIEANEAQEADTESIDGSRVNTRISSMFVELSKKMSLTAIKSPTPSTRTQEYEEFLDGYQNKL